MGSNPTLSAEIVEEFVAGGAGATELVPGPELDPELEAGPGAGGGGERSGLCGGPPSSALVAGAVYALTALLTKVSSRSMSKRALLLLFLFLAAGCSKKQGDDAAPSASTAAATAANANAAPAPAKAGSKLTHADLEAGYLIAKDTSVPVEKRLQILKAKLGEPGRVDGKKAYWQAKEKVCKELELEPNGASVGMVSDSKCP